MLFRKAVCVTLLVFVAFAVPLAWQLAPTWERPGLVADGPAPPPTPPPVPWMGPTSSSVLVADGPAPQPPPPPVPWSISVAA